MAIDENVMEPDDTAQETARHERRSVKERVRLFYEADDFLLYAFSLALVAAAAWLAFPDPLARLAMAGGLAFMLGCFLWKHGVALDRRCLAEIVVGLPSALRHVPGLILPAWRTHLARGGILVAAILLERTLQSRAIGQTAWFRPFPYALVILLVVVGTAALRTVVLIDHLRKRRLVREVLAESGWKRELRGRMGLQLVHAYVTGIIAHACSVMPAMVFWQLTRPTWFREVVLCACALVCSRPRAALALMREARVPRSIPMFIMYSVVPRSRIEFPVAGSDGGARDHRRSHESRFCFTVLHGHHHDAVPCANVGGPGTGFCESLRNAACQLGYLRGTLHAMFVKLMNDLDDMVIHQYVPGVFPRSKIAVDYRVHHVAHHFGSLQPLSLDGRSYHIDVAAGYRPDNPRVRWFLAIAARLERLSPASLERFTQIAPPPSREPSPVEAPR